MFIAEGIDGLLELPANDPVKAESTNIIVSPLLVRGGAHNILKQLRKEHP